MACLLSASSAACVSRPGTTLLEMTRFSMSDRSRYFVQVRCKKFRGGDLALRHSTCSARLDELDVSDAHETEDEAQIRDLVVQCGHSRFLVTATAGDDRKYLFVSQQ